MSFHFFKKFNLLLQIDYHLIYIFLHILHYLHTYCQRFAFAFAFTCVGKHVIHAHTRTDKQILHGCKTGAAIVYCFTIKVIGKTKPTTACMSTTNTHTYLSVCIEMYACMITSKHDWNINTCMHTYTYICLLVLLKESKRDCIEHNVAMSLHFLVGFIFFYQ